MRPPIPVSGSLGASVRTLARSPRNSLMVVSIPSKPNGLRCDVDISTNTSGDIGELLGIGLGSLDQLRHGFGRLRIHAKESGRYLHLEVAGTGRKEGCRYSAT